MSLTRSERQTLTGPVAVGCVLGLFLGFVVVALESEHFGEVSSATVVHAVEAFFIGLALSAVPLGLLPVLLGRLRGRDEDDGT